MYQAAPERRIRIAGWTILPQSDPENTSAWTKRTLVFLTLAGPCAPARVARRSVAFASTLRRDVTEWEQAVDVRICKDAIPKTNMDCPGTDSPPPYTHTVQPPNPNRVKVERALQLKALHLPRKYVRLRARKEFHIQTTTCRPRENVGRPARRKEEYRRPVGRPNGDYHRAPGGDGMHAWN